jgi:RNA polymerase-binding transcription factor DksA
MAKNAPTKSADTSASTATPSKKSAAKSAAVVTDDGSSAPKKAAPPKKYGTDPIVLAPPTIKGESDDGIKYTKDFDLKFLTAQRQLLQEERISLTGQAIRLEEEAHSLIEEAEMGDVQFDDESGEGDTMVVERERDLALSAQARQMVAEIDDALIRITEGLYGYSIVSLRPIPRERLEAIPWATVLVEEKVGGIGRR